ncbi:MAG: CBS domain-containing protein [Anaerolineae bacterium]
MINEPIIFLISDVPASAANPLEDALRERYVDVYRVVAATPQTEPMRLLRFHREQGDQIALFLIDQQGDDLTGLGFLSVGSVMYPKARKVVITSENTAVRRETLDGFIDGNWYPAEKNLYPILDELLADWRASVDMPYMYVSGIMTVRAVRVRSSDSLHRAAEMIALSGVGDLMVVDENNNFVGVLSVGDVLRAAMPNMDEIIKSGGTIEQAFRQFLRKGSELMYKPISPLIISSPITVAPDDHVAKVAALMLEKNIHRLPVVQDGRLVGTVGRTDVCQAVVGTL